MTLGVADYLGEGHDVFHPIKKTGLYDSQKNEAQPYIEQFKKERMPRSGMWRGIRPSLSRLKFPVHPSSHIILSIIELVVT